MSPACAGVIDLATPHSQATSFDPQPIGKYQRCVPVFDEAIIPIHAREMSQLEVAKMRTRRVTFKRLAKPC